MFDLKKSFLGAALFFAVSTGFCKSDSDDLAVEPNLIQDCKELVKQICKKEDKSTAKLVGIRLAKEVPTMIFLVLLYGFYCNYKDDIQTLLRQIRPTLRDAVSKQNNPSRVNNAVTNALSLPGTKEFFDNAFQQDPNLAMFDKNIASRLVVANSLLNPVILNRAQQICKNFELDMTFVYSIYVILRLIMDFRKNKNFVQLEKWLKSLLLNSALSEDDKKMIVKLIESKLGSKISKNAGIMVEDVVYTIYVAAISAVFMHFTFGGHLQSKGKAAPFIADAVAAAVTVLCTSLLTLRQKGVYKEILKQLAVLKA